MELEVSKKVRAAIKAKLLELGCHVDDELPDYIMVLVANRRSTIQMESDLSLFLNENNKKFVNWLTQVLKKLEQVTAPTNLEENTRKPSESGSKIKATKEEDQTKKVVKKTIKKEKNTAAIKVKKVVKKTKGTRKTIAQNRVTESEIPKQENASNNAEDITNDNSQVVPCNKTHDNENSSNASPSKTQTKVKLTMKKPDQGQKLISGIFRDSEEVEIKQSLPMLSDDEETLEEVMKSVIPEEQFNSSQDPSVVSLTQDSSRKFRMVESSVQSDELILNTEENEFADLDELRRIALESQAKKRLKNEIPDEKTIEVKPFNNNKRVESISSDLSTKSTSLIKTSDSKPLRSPKEADRMKEDRHLPIPVNRPVRRILINRAMLEAKDRKLNIQTRRSHSRSRSRSPARLTRKRQSPTGTVGSKKRSVFDRLADGPSRSSRRRQSHSRSPIRRLNSTIGTVINRSDEYDPVRPSVSSVVKVTERPKRDLKVNSKLLMMAVADARESIIRNSQNVPVVDKSDRKRRINEEREKTSIVPKRRFDNFSEVESEDFFEPQEATVPRRSIKDRLGVKRGESVRKSVKDRLGVSNNHVTDPLEEDLMQYYDDDDYSIVINVNDAGGSGENMEKRNVTLANTDLKVTAMNRISIQVNNSEEDDTSDDDGSTSGSDRERESINVKSSSKRDPDGSDSDNFEVSVSVDNDDKLPEVPSEHEYIIEEIEIDESKGSSLSGHEEQLVQEVNSKLKFSSKTSDNDENLALLNVLAPTIDYPVLPDLRGKLNSNHKANSVPKVQPVSSTIRCKYWPKCHYKDGCKYNHPVCRFNPCSNSNCDYKHESPLPAIEKSSTSNKKLVCKFYPKCTSMSCSFYHPSPCRFGLGCTDIKCKNYHPGVTIGMLKLKSKGGTVLPKVNELKWVKKV